MVVTLQVRATIIILFLLCLVRYGSTTNVSIVHEMYLAMTENTEYAEVIPLIDTTEIMNVKVGFYLQSINAFDEVSGQISLSGILNITWREETLSTIYRSKYSEDHPNMNWMSFPITDVWYPELVLLNAAETAGTIGDKAFRVTVNFTEFSASWIPKVNVISSCTADVTYYPFDRQRCSFEYLTWNYPNNFFNLYPQSEKIDITEFDENVEWLLEETKAEKASFLSLANSVKFTIQIKRRSLYYVINIVLPTLLLGMLNGLVFLLPAASGERVGFSITCFLSYVVLTNMIMAVLPRTSSPLSLLCYYIMMMTMFSALMTVMTILTLRLYHKDSSSKIHPLLIKVAKFAMCAGNPCRKGGGKIHACPSENLNGSKASTLESVQAEVHSSDIALTSAVSDRKTRKRHPKLVEVISTSVQEIKLNPAVKNLKMDKKTSNIPAPEDNAIGEEKEECLITWETIGKLVDFVAIIGFITVQVLFSISYLLPLAMRY